MSRKGRADANDAEASDYRAKESSTFAITVVPGRERIHDSGAQRPC